MSKMERNLVLQCIGKKSCSSKSDNSLSFLHTKKPGGDEKSLYYKEGFLRQLGRQEEFPPSKGTMQESA